jgi:hypothetical protein
LTVLNHRASIRERAIAEYQQAKLMQAQQQELYWRQWLAGLRKDFLDDVLRALGVEPEEVEFKVNCDGWPILVEIRDTDGSEVVLGIRKGQTKSPSLYVRVSCQRCNMELYERLYPSSTWQESILYELGRVLVEQHFCEGCRNARPSEVGPSAAERLVDALCDVLRERGILTSSREE